MARKTTKAVESSETVTFSTPEREKLVPLSIDLGREDLNTVVKKVNEIIGHLNS